MYAKAIKWKVVVFKQLMMIKAILTYAKKMQADQKERGVDISAPGALFLLLVDLVKGAKGLSDRCLPYVMLAELINTQYRSRREPAFLLSLIFIDIGLYYTVTT